MSDKNDLQVGVNVYATDSEYEREDIRSYLVESARRKMATWLAQHPELALLDSPVGKWVCVEIPDPLLPEDEPQIPWRHWEYRLLAICASKAAV